MGRIRMKPYNWLLSCLPVLLAVSALHAQEPKYEITGIRYATLKNFPVASLVAGADRSRRMDIGMYVWLIRGGGHTILFDSGFYREKFMTQWKPADYIRPDQAVALAGVKPEEITDVIVSHIHWDHADGFDLFPNARVWIQKDEYVFYTGDAWQTTTRRGGASDAAVVLAMVSANLAGHLTLVDGDDREILPGIRAFTGGKHTYQSQYITVPTQAGTVVLASDNVYLYENLEKHVPIAATLDATSNLRAQDRMKTQASDPRLLIPGHDPAIETKFEVKDGRVIVVR